MTKNFAVILRSDLGMNVYTLAKAGSQSAVTLKLRNKYRNTPVTIVDVTSVNGPKAFWKLVSETKLANEVVLV